jgi:hypothetical protein
LHQLFFFYCYKAYQVYFFLGTYIHIVFQMSLSQPGPVSYTVFPLGTTFFFTNFRCRHTQRTLVRTFSLLVVWCRCAFLATLNIPHLTTSHHIIQSPYLHTVCFPRRNVTMLSSQMYHQINGPFTSPVTSESSACLAIQSGAL